jgi:NAD(P)-dependent dehydrogenase (short-subunit alcohol dehydrogenase family)
MTGRLDGKVALVTGAGSGIGRAIALRAASEGARVLAADITGAEEQVANEARGRGSEVLPFRADVSQPDQVAAMLAGCRARFGRLDVLFNNAGIVGDNLRLHEYTLESWDRVMSVNVRGAFLVLKHALLLMLESGGGAVVNTASLGGFRAVARSSAYVVSKGAVVMMTRVAALEYAEDNIRVNAICPGTVDTPLNVKIPPERIEFMVSQVPMKRLGKVEEVASLALFLASDEASFITGQCYIVDGGRSAG